MLKPYGQGHGSLWDVIGERREQEQRISAPAQPSADYDLARIGLDDAWLWLPNLKPDQALAGTGLGSINADFDHDPRLVNAAGHRRNLRRIRLSAEKPEIRALPRALQLLSGMLAHWKEFAAKIDWDQTLVVLFAPSDIDANPWLDAVLKVWPFDYLPGHGFDAPHLPFDQWLPFALENNLEARFLLCISIDSWTTVDRVNTLPRDRMAGESIALLYLSRVDRASPEEENRLQMYPPKTREHLPRAQQSRKNIDDLQQLTEQLCEQSGSAQSTIQTLITEGHLDDNRLEQLHHYLNNELPHCDMQEHVSGRALLAGEYGKSATDITCLALAVHAARTKGGSALIVDRCSATQTQAWLLTPTKKSPQSDDETSPHSHADRDEQSQYA